MSPILTASEQKAAETAQEWSVAPEGMYVCRVTGICRWQSGVGEVPMDDAAGTSLCWTFKVAKGQPLAGREFKTWTSLKPDSIGRTKGYLTTLGFGLDAEPDDVLGTACKIEVVVEFDNRPDHQGEKQNKVKRIFAYDGPDLPGDYAFEDPFGDSPTDLADDEALF